VTAAGESQRAAEIRERLAALERERLSLNQQLISLERRAEASVRPVLGLGDVFPVRWENARTGTAGHAPACSNEWNDGVCEKPRV
jgi:hypothetical protein